jgi:hypothetical protein
VLLTCCRHFTLAVDKPDESVEVFSATLLRLQNEAEQGFAPALELLWWAGLNAGGLLMEIEAHGTPQARAALEMVAAKHTAWPTLATFSDDSDTRARLRAIKLGTGLLCDPQSQAQDDECARLARKILEHISFVGSVLRAHRAREIAARPRLPMYSRQASRLPRFCRESVPQWWSVVGQVFDRWYPDPASVPWMRALVRNGASAKQVRAAAKRRLRQKLAGLAPR